MQLFARSIHVKMNKCYYARNIPIVHMHNSKSLPAYEQGLRVLVCIVINDRYTDEYE